MARLLVVTSHPPFAIGGHLTIARALVDALTRAGHEAELLLTPQNRFGRQAAAYLATWLTDVGVAHDGRAVDQVISLRYPSYAVRHPRHVCWLNHTMREYYDLWPAFAAPLSWRNRVKEQARRRLIFAADRWLLGRNVHRLFVQSRTAGARIEEALGVASEVLYPPPPLRAYRCDAYEPYLFAVSRLTPLKRFDLLLRALGTARAQAVRAVIAGDGEERGRLRDLAAQLGVADRVEFPGWLDESDLVSHLARCRAVAFVPYQEDYGFVTTEAMASAKPVITTTDSGGPAELVRHGETGRVVAPAPEALGEAIADLMQDEPAARRAGGVARAVVAGWTWDRVLARLLIV